MSGKIFMLQKDGTLKEMNEEYYESEDLLQGLLDAYPNLIAGDQIDSANPRRWLNVAREKSISSSEEGGGRWTVDHLFIDQDAIPTIIEVKRSNDTRIRREVVGQMLEYAANAVTYWKIDELITVFEASCKRKNKEPTIELQEALGVETGYESFWDNVKTNLKAGKVRLLFVADSIPDELQRIIEFMNEQMNQAEVLGVEIKQFIGNEIKTLVPKVIGQTAEALSLNKGGLSHQWDEPSFFEELVKRSGKNVEKTARIIYEWSNKNFSRVWFGKGKTNGSFVPVLEHKGISHQAFAVYTYGTVELYFQWYLYKPPFNSLEKRKELLNNLNAIEGVNISESKIDKRPNIPLSTLNTEGKIHRFINIFEWYINTIKAA